MFLILHHLPHHHRGLVALRILKLGYVVAGSFRPQVGAGEHRHRAGGTGQGYRFSPVFLRHPQQQGLALRFFTVRV